MKSKFLKRALCTTLACATVAGIGLGMTACADDDSVHLVIGVQQTTGNNYVAMCNLLDAWGPELGFTYETVLIGRNAEEAYNTYQNAIVSGASGIITMVDVDAPTTRRIIELCEDNNAYYAGFMTDFASTFANSDPAQTENVEYVMNSGAMLGAVTDGDIVRDGGARGEFLFNEIVETDYRTITLVRSPLYAYPVAATAIDRFKELAEEYNETHDDDFTFVTAPGAQTSDSQGALEIGFGDSEVDAEVVQSWASQGVEAVVAVNSLGNKLLSNVKTYGNGMVIYQIGRDDLILGDFPDTIKSLCQTPTETIVYPLVRVLNAINGNSYSDEPTDKMDTLLSGQYVYFTSAEDLEAGDGNSIAFTENYPVSASIVTVDDIRGLLAGAEGASFAKLSGLIASWDTDYVLYRR